MPCAAGGGPDAVTVGAVVAAVIAAVFWGSAVVALLTDTEVGGSEPQVAPLVFFVRQLREAAHTSRQRFALALAGLVVVTSYASFGLSEVIFWSVGGSLFYSLMIFLLIGFSLNAKDNNEI